MTQHFTRITAAVALLWGHAAFSSAGLIWRIDFNGAGADTLTASNFTGWTLSASSRTQVVVNVDGGPLSRSLVVAFPGGGTFGSYERTMNVGSATNLYRDGGQGTVSPVTMVLSNLLAGHTYQVRLWYFDDEFSIGNTQSYVEVTDGGSRWLGALTNVTSANASAGNAKLPLGLYDYRYMMEALLVAGAQGSLAIALQPSAGNAKWNALEVMDVTAAAIAYSDEAFVESDNNDGRMGNALQLVLSGDGYAGSDGDDFIADNRAEVTGLPAGLVAEILRQSESSLIFLLSGQALAHGAEHSISNLHVRLLDAAFVSGVAAGVDQSTRTNLQIRFSDVAVPVLSYENSVFHETPANDGQVGPGLSLTLRGDAFTGTNGQDLVATGAAGVEHVPSGLTAHLVRQGISNLWFTLEGQASAHGASDSIANLTLTMRDGAFDAGQAAQVQGYTRSDLQVVFSDPAVPPVTNGVWLSWSSVPGQRYAVEWSSNLADFVVLVSNVPANLALTSITSAPPATASPVLYRIRVE